MRLVDLFAGSTFTCGHYARTMRALKCYLIPTYSLLFISLLLYIFFSILLVVSMDASRFVSFHLTIAQWPSIGGASNRSDGLIHEIGIFGLIKAYPWWPVNHTVCFGRSEDDVDRLWSKGG